MESGNADGDLATETDGLNPFGGTGYAINAGVQLPDPLASEIAKQFATDGRLQSGRFISCADCPPYPNYR